MKVILLAIILFLAYALIAGEVSNARVSEKFQDKLVKEFSAVFYAVETNEPIELYHNLSSEFQRSLISKYGNKNTITEKLKTRLIGQFRKYSPIELSGYSINDKSAIVCVTTYLDSKEFRKNILNSSHGRNDSPVLPGGGELYQIDDPGKGIYNASFLFVKQQSQWKLHQITITRDPFDSRMASVVQDELGKLSN
jgi:hypothetical protein